MKCRSLLLVLLLFVSDLFAQRSVVERPKLVVGIVLDQMRWDYLYRYYDRYENGGFKRLMNDGFNCQNAFINYLPTYTAPGHSSIYTGAVPAIHGIVANGWLDNVSLRYWYCTEDTMVQPVGGSIAAGRMSPRNMLTTTISDELRLATNMRSRVFGIGLKDRSSILPAGHLANGAYWFDDSTGNFFTSTFYSKQLPEWVIRFNNRRLADTFLNEKWQLSFPLESYQQSLPDHNPYEGVFPGEATPIFPHAIGGVGSSGYNALRYLPKGNTITIEMAKACLEAEALGRNEATDFLAISFSSTDYAGHRYAPNSVEMEDMFLKFDRELADFLSYLDKNVGKGAYTLFLTADHGAAHNIAYLEDLKIPAGAEQDIQLYTQVNSELKKIFGVDSLVNVFTNYQVYLNEPRISSAKINRNDVKSTIVKWLETQNGISYAVDMEVIGRVAIAEPVRSMMVNGFHRKRSGVIQIIPEPAWYSGYVGNTGTTHGSWNPYDSHIPLLWYGWGIPKGETHRNIYMTDIAATLAALLRIQMPNGCVGNVIQEIVK